MTCAKKIVKCTIETKCGHFFTGTNDCNEPVLFCPREQGEDYTKCRTICKQPGHAEEIALQAAIESGLNLNNAIAYVTGIDNFCKECQIKLYDAGIRTLRFMS